MSTKAGEVHWIDRVKLERRKQNLTQLELAKKMGVTQGYVSNVLNRRKGYTLDKVYIFAKALGMSFDALYHGCEPSEKINFQVPLLTSKDLIEWDTLSVKKINQNITCPKQDRGSRTFAYTLEDETMEPFYRNGSIVYVDPDKDPTKGNSVIYINNGYIRLRNLIYIDGSPWLRPYNSQYPAEKLSGGAIFCGTVIASYNEEQYL